MTDLYLDVEEIASGIASYNGDTSTKAKQALRKYVAGVTALQIERDTFEAILREQAEEIAQLKAELHRATSAAQDRGVRLAPDSLRDIADAVRYELGDFFVREESDKESGVKIPAAYETPEAFQDAFITVDHNSYEYRVECAGCGYVTTAPSQNVADVAAYDHAEEHVNEAKEAANG